MTHDDLLAKINANRAKIEADIDLVNKVFYKPNTRLLEIRDRIVGHIYANLAVVELHKPEPLDERGDVCLTCCPDLLTLYPCPTIQAIEKELG